MRSQQVATLPWFRAGGGYLVPLFAAQSRHEKPYPPMSKISFAFPFTVPSKGNVCKYTPFPRPTQAGFWEFEVLRAGAQGLTRDVRRETRDASRREPKRQCGFANVSTSHVSARLSSIVSCPRAGSHLADGGRVRGMSLMRICDVPGTGREITVRNVCFLLADLDGTFFVQKSIKILRPFKIQPRLDVM